MNGAPDGNSLSKHLLLFDPQEIAEREQRRKDEAAGQSLEQMLMLAEQFTRAAGGYVDKGATTI